MYGDTQTARFVLLLRPLLHLLSRPFSRFIGVAAVATVRHAVLDRVEGRDEIKTVVARFAGHGILPDQRHVTLDTKTTLTAGLMVRMVRQCFSTERCKIVRAVTGQAK